MPEDGAAASWWDKFARSKHDVVADVRRLSYEAPRHPSATFALVLVAPHPVRALQQFCFGHTRAWRNSQGTRTWLLLSPIPSAGSLHPRAPGRR